MMQLVLSGVLGYLIGAIPTGVLIGRILTGKNVYQQGSGHTGGLNTLRLAGFWAGALTAIIDILLGVGAVTVARLLTDDPWAMTVAGVMAVIGHDWSIYIRFGGGIGLAKLAGAVAGIVFLPTLKAVLILVVLWVVILIRLLRVHRARATILTVLVVGPVLWLLGLPPHGILLGVLGGLVVIIKTIPDWNRQY